jgi:hypothetical protein
MMGMVKESGVWKEKVKQIEFIKLPPRTESVARLPVSPPVGVRGKCGVGGYNSSLTDQV